MYARLQQVLGPKHADTLMTYLPQHRSDEVATRGDIVHLGSKFEHLESKFEHLETRFDRVEARFDGLETRFDHFQDVVRDQQRFYVGVTVGSMTALTAIFSLVVGMLG
jgi:hypothetical protein